LSPRISTARSRLASRPSLPRIWEKEGQTLRDWFTQALGSADHPDQLAAVCERLDVDKDAIIAAQGESANSMHFILEGRVGIIVNMDDGRSIRVRSLGPHTTIGEMGLITSQLRSATIQAEVPSVLYALSADALRAHQTRERTSRPSFAHLCDQHHGRAFELCQQGNRRVAPLAQGEFLRPIAARRGLNPPARARNQSLAQFLTSKFLIGIIKDCAAAPCLVTEGLAAGRCNVHFDCAGQSKVAKEDQCACCLP
jgi:CRP-like cAMP-binding protein